MGRTCMKNHALNEGAYLDEYLHEYDKDKSCQDKDRKAKASYKKSLDKSGIVWRESTTKENKSYHIDYYITLNGKEFSNDLKSIKRKNGRDWGDEPDDWEWLWIEFHGKYKEGNEYKPTKGWLYAERLSIVTFECNTYFLLVSRKDLEKLCDTIVDKKSPPVKKAPNAIRKTYSRGADLLAKIHVSDILDSEKKYGITVMQQQIPKATECL